MMDNADPNNLLAGGNTTLLYQLYKDPARSQVWGDGTVVYGGSGTPATGVTTFAFGPPLQTYIVFGAIIRGGVTTTTNAGLAVGQTFTDTVNVTINA